MSGCGLLKYCDTTFDSAKINLRLTGTPGAILITSRKMTAPDVTDAFGMLSDFLGGDEHYLASSEAYGDRGIQGLNDALYLFLEHPDLGFVWMAYDEDEVAGVCVICYAV